MMMMVDGSSSSSTGWVVCSKLSNDEYRECGGAGQKKIGKIRQQSCSFTQRGGGRFLLKLFSSISSEIKRKLAQQLFRRKELAGSLSQAFFSSDFDCIPKGFDE